LLLEFLIKIREKASNINVYENCVHIDKSYRKKHIPNVSQYLSLEHQVFSKKAKLISEISSYDMSLSQYRNASLTTYFVNHSKKLTKPSNVNDFENPRSYFPFDEKSPSFDINAIMHKLCLNRQIRSYDFTLVMSSCLIDKKVQYNMIKLRNKVIKLDFRNKYCNFDDKKLKPYLVLRKVIKHKCVHIPIDLSSKSRRRIPPKEVFLMTLKYLPSCYFTIFNSENSNLNGGGGFLGGIYVQNAAQFFKDEFSSSSYSSSLNSSIESFVRNFYGNSLSLDDDE